jgi:hypothetical protein
MPAPGPECLDDSRASVCIAVPLQMGDPEATLSPVHGMWVTIDNGGED